MDGFKGGDLLPLAAFAAGVMAPDRSGQLSQNLQFFASQQAREKELAETRAFREKQFGLQQEQFAAQQGERADIGKTREQERTARELEIAQRRQQAKAGELYPQLQFSGEQRVGVPDIPPQFGISDQLRSQDKPTMTGVPGWEVKAPQVSTLEDIRKQVGGMQGVEPGVQSELLQMAQRAGTPVVPPAERPEVMRAQQALAVEQALAPTIGPLPARRMSALVRTGESTLAPELIRRLVTRDVTTVDLGTSVGLVDKNTGQMVGSFAKQPQPTVQVVDDPITRQKKVLLIHPLTGQVQQLNAGISAGGVVDPDFSRFMSMRAQNMTTPDMPAELAQVTPEQAKQVLLGLGIGAGGGSQLSEMLKFLDVGKPGAPVPTPSPGGGAPPAARSKGKLRYNQQTGQVEEVEE